MNKRKIERTVSRDKADFFSNFACTKTSMVSGVTLPLSGLTRYCKTHWNGREIFKGDCWEVLSPYIPSRGRIRIEIVYFFQTSIARRRCGIGFIEPIGVSDQHKKRLFDRQLARSILPAEDSTGQIVSKSGIELPSRRRFVPDAQLHEHLGHILVGTNSVRWKIRNIL